MDSQKAISKPEELLDMPRDPFAVDIFGAKKNSLPDEPENTSETPAETENSVPEKNGNFKKRPAWNAALPKVSAREVEFSKLLQKLPVNLTSRAARAVEQTIARYTFQTPDAVKCRLASVREVNLSRAVGERAQSAQVFLTLGCQSENAAAIIALNADFASAVIDLILGGAIADYTAPNALTPIEIAIVEFLAINITKEINDWLGHSVLCLRKVSGSVPDFSEKSERGAEFVFRLNLASLDGAFTFYSSRDFLSGLDAAHNSLFEKKTFAEQISEFERLALKLNLRLPIGTTRLTADDLLYLEQDDIILIENTENTWAGGEFTGELSIYVGNGKNYRLNGTKTPDGVEKNGAPTLTINQIAFSPEQRKITAAKLKMDEPIKEETEAAELEIAANTPEESPENDGAILDSVVVDLRVEMAGGKISLSELQNLRRGQIIALGCRPTDPVRIVADGSDQPIASGELIDVEGNLGVRLIKVFI